MLRHVGFKNYKGLRDVGVDLEQLTVLVGPNASGKTSVLDGLDTLARAGTEKLANLFGDRDERASLRTRGSDGDIVMEVSGEWGGTEGSHSLSVGVEAIENKPAARVSSTWGGQEHLREFAALNEDPRWLHREIGEVLERTVLLRLDPRKLAEPAHSVPGNRRLASDGSGLAALLTDLKLTWEDSFGAVQEALRAVIPAVERVRLVRAPVRQVEWETVAVDQERILRPVTREYSGFRVAFDMAGAPDIPGTQASEGTLLMLGLLTVLHGHEPPRLVLLDDLDRSLHPRAQIEIVSQLRKILAARPDLQVVATSHSPFLLDALRFEEVRITTLAPDGSVQLAPLAAHPDYERWKDYMQPGEFWSMVAEQWVQDRRAGHG